VGIKKRDEGNGQTGGYPKTEKKTRKVKGSRNTSEGGGEDKRQCETTSKDEKSRVQVCNTEAREKGHKDSPPIPGQFLGGRRSKPARRRTVGVTLKTVFRRKEWAGKAKQLKKKKSQKTRGISEKIRFEREKYQPTASASKTAGWKIVLKKEGRSSLYPSPKGTKREDGLQIRLYPLGWNHNRKEGSSIAGQR